jgi:transposase
MRTRTEELPTVARRLSAAQLLLAGSPVSAVATALNLSTATVKRYKAILDDGGLDALKKMSVGGRSSVLDAEALEWIADALRGSAQQHGFPSDAWTNARLRELIGARFGVQYSRVYTWQIATNLGLGHRLSKSSR